MATTTKKSAAKNAAALINQWAEVLRMLGDLKTPPRRTLCHGRPGTGKTTWALSLSPESERITLTQGMFPDALLGKFLLRDGSTYWADGPATRAARKGVPLVLDEINKAGSELDSTLQAILDDLSVCRLNLDNGETIEPAPGFRVIATMNGSPDQLAEAVLDRFDVVLKCNTPHPGLLKRLTPDAATFIENKMKNEPEADLWIPTLTPRRMLSFCHLRGEGFDDALAAELCFGIGQGAAILTAMIDAQRNSVGTTGDLDL